MKCGSLGCSNNSGRSIGSCMLYASLSLKLCPNYTLLTEEQWTEKLKNQQEYIWKLEKYINELENENLKLKNGIKNPLDRLEV